MNRRIRLIVSLASVTIGTTVALLAVKGWRHAIAAVGIAIAGALMGADLLRGLRDVLPEPRTAFDRLLDHTPRRPARPADLESLERALGWKTYSADEFEHRVWPILYRLARHRLLDHSGVDLDREPERAPELVRRYLLEPPAATVTTADIGALVDRIEEL